MARMINPDTQREMIRAATEQLTRHNASLSSSIARLEDTAVEVAETIRATVEPEWGVMRAPVHGPERPPAPTTEGVHVTQPSRAYMDQWVRGLAARRNAELARRTARIAAFGRGARRVFYVMWPLLVWAFIVGLIPDEPVINLITLISTIGIMASLSMSPRVTARRMAIAEERRERAENDRQLVERGDRAYAYWLETGELVVTAPADWSPTLGR